MRGARLPKKAQQGAGRRSATCEDVVAVPSFFITSFSADAGRPIWRALSRERREDAVPQASCGRDGEPRVPQPAWLSRPKRGRRRGRAGDGCCGGSAQVPMAERGRETRELWRGTELIGAVFADRRTRLDALRVRCRKRATSVAKPRPHCNSSRRRSATAAAPGAKRSRRRAPVSHPLPLSAARRLDAKRKAKRGGRGERSALCGWQPADGEKDGRAPTWGLRARRAFRRGRAARSVGCLSCGENVDFWPPNRVLARSDAPLARFGLCRFCRPGLLLCASIPFP